MINKKLLVIPFIAFLLLLPGVCLAKSQYITQVNNVEPKVVADYLVKSMVATGYSILSTSEHQVSFRRDIDDFWGQVFLGSRFNTVPELRAYFNLVQSGNNTLVTAEVKIVTNPNSGFEHYTEVSNKSWQDYLDSLNPYFNGYEGYGIAWADKKKEDCLEVTWVSPRGPADNVGIKAGDLISTVKGFPVGDTDMKKINEMFHEGTIGTLLSVKIKTKQTERNVVMTKGFIPPGYKKPVTTGSPIYGFTNGEVDSEGNLPIISVTSGSSADRAGLKAGDKILRINGKLVSEYTPETLKQAFSGGEGAKVELIIATRGNQTERTVVLEKTYVITKSEW